MRLSWGRRADRDSCRICGGATEGGDQQGEVVACRSMRHHHRPHQNTASRVVHMGDVGGGRSNSPGTQGGTQPPTVSNLVETPSEDDRAFVLPALASGSASTISYGCSATAGGASFWA